MKSICYIVPYFGKFPAGFPLWLKSCEYNPTVNWIIFTDDKRNFNYPDNVKVYYMTFEELKEKFQSKFDFKICLDRPYKLCDFKPAYGEIFSDYLQGYDFWGHCDIDLIWGDIRRFYTDEILNSYDRISRFGHSSLFKNNPIINTIYKKDFPGIVTAKEVYTSDKSFAYDEVGSIQKFKQANIGLLDCYNFANLDKYNYGFYLCDCLSDPMRNNHQLFSFDRGHIIRYYLDKDNKVHEEEFLYLHYWCRPISFKIKDYNNVIWIYPEIACDKKIVVSPHALKKYTRRNPIRYYAKSIWQNRKRITLKRIMFNLKGKAKYDHTHSK